LLSSFSWLSAQQIEPTVQVTTVPRLVRISGTFRPPIALPVGSVESVTFSIYKEPEGGTPLWQETQNVTLDAENHYTVLIGSTLNDGIPVELFKSSEPRWLGVRFNRLGEVEQPRTQMASVPYALRASDAETLGGLPAAAYVRVPTAASGTVSTAATAGTRTSATTTESAKVKPKTTSGTTNCIAAFANATDLGCSPMWQSGGNVGVGTTAPASTLDIQNSAAGFTNLLNMRSNFTGGGVGAAGVTLSHQFATMLMRAYSPGAPGSLQNSIGWFALNGSNKLLIGHAGTSPGNDLGFFTSNSWANPQLVLTQAGKVGIGTTTPAFNLDVVGQINASNLTASGPGVNGTSNNPNGAGVRGFNSATSGFPAGVQGGIASNSGAGVFGIANQAGAVGVQGNNNGTSGFAVGVMGTTSSNSGAGVQGINGATSGFSIGVAGNAASPNGAGVNGYNSDTSGTGYPVGVVGSVAGSTGTGVQGNASKAGASGVSGSNGATSGFTIGVGGNASSPNGAGVNGFNSDTSGTGYPVGVVGGVAGSTGTGVQGNASKSGASGVSGFNSATSGFAVGVQGGTASNNGAGVQGNASHAGAAGVAGWNSATSGWAVGVQGGTSSTSGAGVAGNANAAGQIGTIGSNGATSGWGVGTEGVSGSPAGIGVWAVNMTCGSSSCTLVPGTAGQFQTATTGVLLQGISGAAGANTGTSTQVFLVDGHGNGSYAGNLQVSGNLNVGGTISKLGGSFRIDDPIDPANKYLYHSFVESPDMKNIYDGVVTLDEKGEAVVALPDWFEALNQEFRYQLTCIGGYAPVYVASEISHNEFHIGGGSKGLKVSWQVTGIRHDAYANSHRIPVEVDKSGGEKGVIDPVTPAAVTTR
jgi:hypothetical protein